MNANLKRIYIHETKQPNTKNGYAWAVLSCVHVTYTVKWFKSMIYDRYSVKEANERRKKKLVFWRRCTIRYIRYLKNWHWKCGLSHTTKLSHRFMYYGMGDLSETQITNVLEIYGENTHTHTKQHSKCGSCELANGDSSKRNIVLSRNSNAANFSFTYIYLSWNMAFWSWSVELQKTKTKKKWPTNWEKWASTHKILWIICICPMWCDYYYENFAYHWRLTQSSACTKWNRRRVMTMTMMKLSYRMNVLFRFVLNHHR